MPSAQISVWETQKMSLDGVEKPAMSKSIGALTAFPYRNISATVLCTSSSFIALSLMPRNA